MYGGQVKLLPTKLQQKGAGKGLAMIKGGTFIFLDSFNMGA